MGSRARRPTSKGKSEPRKAALVPVPPFVPATGSAAMNLRDDIRFLVEAARSRVATAVNTELVMLNWRIRTRIPRDTLGQEHLLLNSPCPVV